MSRNAGSMHAGSWNSFLATLDVGERRYIETTVDRYGADMRTINTPASRRPEVLKGRKFSTCLFTAVSSSKAGDIRYLICIERTQ